MNFLKVQNVLESNFVSFILLVNLKCNIDQLEAWNWLYSIKEHSSIHCVKGRHVDELEPGKLS
jgi:hypothetical protein